MEDHLFAMSQWVCPSCSVAYDLTLAAGLGITALAKLRMTHFDTRVSFYKQTLRVDFEVAKVRLGVYAAEMDPVSFRITRQSTVHCYPKGTLFPMLEIRGSDGVVMSCLSYSLTPSYHGIACTSACESKKTDSAAASHAAAPKPTSDLKEVVRRAQMTMDAAVSLPPYAKPVAGSTPSGGAATPQLILSPVALDPTPITK